MAPMAPMAPRNKQSDPRVGNIFFKNFY